MDRGDFSGLLSRVRQGSSHLNLNLSSGRHGCDPIEPLQGEEEDQDQHRQRSARRRVPDDILDHALGEELASGSIFDSALHDAFLL